MSAETEKCVAFELPADWIDFGYGDLENIVLNGCADGEALVKLLAERQVSCRHAPAVIHMLWAVQQMAWGDWRAAVREVNWAIFLLERANGQADVNHLLMQPFFGAIDERVIALALFGPIQVQQCFFKRLQRFLCLWTGGQVLDYGVDHRAGVRRIAGLVVIRQWIGSKLFKLRQMVFKADKFKWT